MAIVSSGQISIQSVITEKGYIGSNAANASLTSLSTTDLNTLDPTPRVPANTSTINYNRPDQLTPHRLSEFYAYNHHYTTTTTTAAPATTTTTTAAPGTTTTTTVAPTTTTTTLEPGTTTTTTGGTTTTTTAGTTTTTTGGTTTTTSTTTTTQGTTTTTTSTTTTNCYTSTVTMTTASYADYNDACANATGFTTYYVIDGPNTVWLNSNCTGQPTSNYYADNLGNYRFITSGGILSSAVACPTPGTTTTTTGGTTTTTTTGTTTTTTAGTTTTTTFACNEGTTYNLATGNYDCGSVQAYDTSATQNTYNGFWYQGSGCTSPLNGTYSIISGGYVVGHLNSCSGGNCSYVNCTTTTSTTTAGTTTTTTIACTVASDTYYSGATVGGNCGTSEQTIYTDGNLYYTDSGCASWSKVNGYYSTPSNAVYYFDNGSRSYAGTCNA